ncbi:ATP phosphoribosyltransferase regulatory subunit [subsurface metagenome]
MYFDSADVQAAQNFNGNWQVLAQTGAANSNADRLLSLFLDLRGESSSFLENLRALPQISSDLKSELNSFAEVASLLDVLDCNYHIDITSTRGFEYYTGLCFQFLVKQDRIVSGGRYDNLVPLIGGKSTPACGFALYIDPLIDLVEPEVRQTKEQRILVRSETTMPNATKASFELAQCLREAGYVAELDFSGRQPDWRWVITVEEKPSSFIVIDQIQNQKTEASSIANVIDIMGGSE